MLALCISLCLAGCSRQAPAEPASTEPASTEPPVTEAVTQPAETEAPTAAPAFESFDRSREISPSLLLDSPDLRITADQLQYGEQEVLLVLRVENRRDTYLTLSPELQAGTMLAVNGSWIPCQGEFFRAAPGETVTYHLPIPYEEMELRGITALGELEFCLEGDGISTGFLSVSTGKDSASFLETAAAPSEALGWKPLWLGDRSFYERSGIRHRGTAIVETSEGERMLSLDFENTSADVKILSLGEFGLNGLHLPIGGQTALLLPGCHSQFFLDLTALEKTHRLSDLGMDMPGSLELLAALYDRNMKPVFAPLALSLILSEEPAELPLPETLLYEEEKLQVYYGGAFREEDGALTLSLIYDSRYQEGFLVQAMELTREGEKLPFSMPSLSFTGRGRGLLSISLPAEIAADLTGGSLTLKTLEQPGRTRTVRSYSLPLA